MSFSKVQLTGKITLETGLHIGGSDAFAAIGATDSPIIKDPLTNLPIIPGSSLKGKIRSLLAKVYNEKPAKSPSDDHERIKRLFGDANSEKYKMGRLIFRDAILINQEDLAIKVDSLTEVKFENTIDRISAMATPRQIERAIRGSEFNFELIYDVVDADQAKEDIDVIIKGLQLLSLDYLGGSGSRGYGQVIFGELAAHTVIGDYDASDLEGRLSELNEVG